MRVLISGDYNAFNEGFDGSGIYLASGIAPSATFERSIYIGSAERLGKRIQNGHINSLKHNTHANPPFQRSWDKHGADNFIWFLIEPCNAENLLEREQYYLDIYRPFCDEMKGFNICKHAASRRGIKATPETKHKMSESRKGKNHSDAHKEAIRKGMMGKNSRPLSLEHRAKLSAAKDAKKRKAWLTHATDGTHLAEGIRTFALERGLTSQNLYKVCDKVIKSYKGWRLATPDEITKAQGGIS